MPVALRTGVIGGRLVCDGNRCRADGYGETQCDNLLAHSEPSLVDTGTILVPQAPYGPVLTTR